MQIVGIILSLQFIVLVAFLLYKKYNPQAVLLFSGLAMMALGLAIGFPIPGLVKSTGFSGFDLFAVIKESFSSKGAGVGLMIMTIGGFVSYMRKIGASDALVYISMQPLSLFKKHPYLAASLVIPIGQLLFICTPSATGLGLLLVASIFPVLVSLGVSRLSAVSVITACTVFDMGPASANTARASELIGKNNVAYFLENQLPITIPLTILLMLMYFFLNRYYDKKMGHKPELIDEKEFKIDVPAIYAILPILPLILLVVFSPIFQFIKPPIMLDTTTAMIMAMIVAVVFELIRRHNVKEVFASLKIFWEGMGKVFATVITLIVSAEIFSRGLISLGFVNGLISGSQHIGFGAIGISVVMTIMIFTASILMGSGNASFFSFGPLVPNIAAKLGVDGVSLILPMQLASSMGRAVSPISGVVIATAEIAQVSPFDLAKRNIIPLISVLIFMLFYHSIL
ncbi:MAG: C4-dicarboxylate transporter DcuC [Bacteroidales bacterium]|nr:C4-dicarboxylate transporter DcuC [Bacteroidales bacterium]MCF8390924.1 C4-dicarboxylate transporter DcuC [Bacteroidales bacterium]